MQYEIAGKRFDTEQPDELYNAACAFAAVTEGELLVVTGERLNYGEELVPANEAERNVLYALLERGCSITMKERGERLLKS